MGKKGIIRQAPRENGAEIALTVQDDAEKEPHQLKLEKSVQPPPES